MSAANHDEDVAVSATLWISQTKLTSLLARLEQDKHFPNTGLGGARPDRLFLGSCRYGTPEAPPEPPQDHPTAPLTPPKNG